MEGEPGPLRSSEKQGVGHHTQARALWLREKAKTGIVGASNLVEKQVESPRPVKTQNSQRGNFTPPLGLEPKWLEPARAQLSVVGLSLTVKQLQLSVSKQSTSELNQKRDETNVQSLT